MMELQNKARYPCANRWAVANDPDGRWDPAGCVVDGLRQAIQPVGYWIRSKMMGDGKRV